LSGIQLIRPLANTRTVQGVEEDMPYIPDNLNPEQAARNAKIIQAMTPKGGYRNKDLQALGIKTPLTSGWRRRYVLRGPDCEPQPVVEQISLI